MGGQESWGWGGSHEVTTDSPDCARAPSETRGGGVTDKVWGVASAWNILEKKRKTTWGLFPLVGEMPLERKDADPFPGPGGSSPTAPDSGAWGKG